MKYHDIILDIIMIYFQFMIELIRNILINWENPSQVKNSIIL
jgi:hypothetical protein